MALIIHIIRQAWIENLIQAMLSQVHDMTVNQLGRVA